MFHNPTPLNVSQKSGPRYSCISYITTRTSLRRRSYTGVRDAAHFSHFPDRDRTGARNARARAHHGAHAMAGQRAARTRTQHTRPGVGETGRAEAGAAQRREREV